MSSWYSPESSTRSALGEKVTNFSNQAVNVVVVRVRLERDLKTGDITAYAKVRS